jgi:hypothetical protein
MDAWQEIIGRKCHGRKQMIRLDRNQKKLPEEENETRDEKDPKQAPVASVPLRAQGIRSIVGT